MRRLAGVPLLILGLLIAAWLRLSDEITLRLQLSRWQFGLLETQLATLAVLSWLNLPRLVRSLRLARPWVLAAAAASLLALVLGGAVAPRTNRIYYDEHIYEGVGQNLSDLHAAQMCLDGTVEYGVLQCARGEYSKEPYGYPYLLSLGYRLFGVHETIAHRLNVLCAAALVWVVFFLACALFEDPRAGAFAAFVLALVPQQVLWSHTAAVEPSSALMSALAVVAAVHHVRERSTLSLLWMVVATAFAVQFRPESVLVIPLIGLIVLACVPAELLRARLWLAAALGLALCALHVGHLAAVRGEAWGATGPALSLTYVWSNLKVNGLFYLNNARFPAAFSVLALLGLAGRPGRAVGLVSAWFLLFWGVFLFFYAGSYEYGADVRYSLVSYAPLALLAGRGASWLHDAAERLGLGARRASQAVGVLLCAQLLWFLPQIRAVGEEAWGARADVAFAQRVIPDLPPNSVVVTHNPSIFLVNGVNAAQMSMAAGDPSYVSALLAGRYAGGVFLHWNAWCNYADVQQRTFCEEALRLYGSRLFREYRERDFRFAFYRLITNETLLKKIVKAAPSGSDEPSGGSGR